MITEALNTETRQPQQHLAYLDGLRAFAALFVIVCHEAYMRPWDGASRMMPLIRVLNFGHYAVDLFIVLSGFCLMLPVAWRGELKGGAWVFFRKRARRILPPYYAALGLSLVLALTLLRDFPGSLWGLCVPVTRASVIAHLLLIHDLFTQTAGKISLPLWSISVEWRIYFAFPLLVWLWRRIGGSWATLLTVAASLLLVGLLRHWQPGNDSVCPQYLGLFALGGWWSMVAFAPDARMEVLRRRVPWGAVAVGLFAALWFFSVVPLRHGATLPVFLRDYVCGPLSVALLLAASQGPATWLHTALSWRPLVFVGTFAYSVYLVHFPVLALFDKCLLHLYPFRTMDLFLIAVVAATPLILLVAYGFHLVFERPFMTKPL